MRNSSKVKILNNGSKSSKSKTSEKPELTREKSHDAFTSFEKIMVDRIIQTEIALVMGLLTLRSLL